MNWTCLHLITQPEYVELLSDLLVAQEIYEFSVQDPREFSEYLETSVYYDYVEDKLLAQKDAIICIYAPENGQGEEKKERALRAMELA